LGVHKIEPFSEAIIRPYRPTDRDAVHQIAADTAFFGAPVEAFLEDRRLFLDAFYRYYTEFEPQYAWVAIAAADGGEGPVVGFLTGCLDTARQQRFFIRKLIPGALWGALSGRYRLGPKTWRYTGRLFREALLGALPKADLQAYPAHLHINVEASWRGKGLGRKLLLNYLDQIQQAGAGGVHLETTSQNTAACRLYEKLGFQRVSAHSTRLWEGYIHHPVENRVYARRLGTFHGIISPVEEGPSANRGKAS
jgi:ribosomal protein S18 acetylase RimI-like enzyme